jgi:hypothetical protein
MHAGDGSVFDFLDPVWFKAYLQHSMTPPQELDKTWHDITLDDPIDPLDFRFGEQIPEFGRSVQLAGWIIRENILDHLLGQLIKE